MNLYYNNRSRTSAGLALVNKLKYEHIYLTSYSKMRVDLAVQVSKGINLIAYYRGCNAFLRC